MVYGISLVKDEADIVLACMTRMLRQVDHIVVLDNGSTDGTREILDSLGVEVIDDPDPAHYQSRKMSALAAKVAERGASWVLPFDADEIWYSPFGRIADVLTDQPAAISQAEVYHHFPSALDEGDEPFSRIGWRSREPLPLAKVACRPRLSVTIHDGNHGADYGYHTEKGMLVVRHFPYRSPGQFVSKVRNGAAALAATNLSEETGKHWRDFGRLLEAGGEAAIHKVFYEQFYLSDPTSDTSMIYDPAP